MTEFKQWWVIAPVFQRVMLVLAVAAGITANIGLLSSQVWVAFAAVIAMAAISVIMWVGYYICRG